MSPQTPSPTSESHLIPIVWERQIKLLEFYLITFIASQQENNFMSYIFYEDFGGPHYSFKATTGAKLTNMVVLTLTLNYIAFY